ncbi:MAG: electron transfer flavoprotein subunit alpha/FixB family protein [Thermoanaerobaculia bacterium]|nr:MAG: electron transfer flavoprotein subunit alpha/FixB family protein [Thermoanaerobaculia bacterium]MBZ0101530.1 electron transfer flavoprotein subunit alpha/FixB family protein [Thermoanaerobaculia bacterium]
MSGVWVVLQHRDGKLHRGSREAIAAGQQLAAGSGAKATAVLLGEGLGALAAEAAACDLAAVRTADSPVLAAYTPGAYTAALLPALAAARPDYVLFPHTYQSCEYVPALARALDATHLPEAIAFEEMDGALVFRRPVLEGKLQARVRVKGDGPVLVTLQSGAFQADGCVAGSAPVSPLDVDLATLVAGREIVGTEQVAADTIDLSKAAVILAVGRGVGGADKLAPIEELARLLGAEIGASRPVIDSGWLPRDRQIGSSGQTVAPKLYVAIGISGAIQHLVGMKASSVIVAVNKDAGAPIFKVAHYGVVGDLHEVVPALTAAIRELRG